MSAADALRVNAIRGSRHAYQGKLKRPPLPSGCEISRATRLSGFLRVEGAMLQGGPSTCARCRDPFSWWDGARKAMRINSIRIPQEDMWRAPLSGLPQGEAHGTREHHTRTIAYPIWICCPDHWLMWASLATSFWQPAIAHVPPPSDGVSGHPIRTSLPWIPKNFPQSRIALVIKKLSKHQNLTQFD